MDNKFNKETSNKYAFNDAMILDKIQEILEDKNLDDIEFTEEDFDNIKKQLSENISLEDINESAYILAKNIEELKVSPNEDIKEYILKLKNYLNNSDFKCLIGEFQGIEFEVLKDSSAEDLFKNFYAKYDETYGISEMLSDLGLK